MKNTTIKISEETSDNLKALKLKYRYKSMDEIVNESTRYFIEYNLSPRNSSKPIIEQFDRIDKTVRSFFKEYENKLFKPFVNAQSEVNIQLLDFMDNNNVVNKTSKTSENIDNILDSSLEEKKYVFSEKEFSKMKKLVTELEEKFYTGLKQESKEDGTYYLISSHNFFTVKDVLSEVNWFFKKD